MRLSRPYASIPYRTLYEHTRCLTSTYDFRLGTVIRASRLYIQYRHGIPRARGACVPGRRGARTPGPRDAGLRTLVDMLVELHIFIYTFILQIILDTDESESGHRSKGCLQSPQMAPADDALVAR
jgi:hypothetical protein